MLSRGVLPIITSTFKTKIDYGVSLEIILFVDNVEHNHKLMQGVVYAAAYRLYISSNLYAKYYNITFWKIATFVLLCIMFQSLSMNSQ